MRSKRPAFAAVWNVGHGERKLRQPNPVTFCENELPTPKPGPARRHYECTGPAACFFPG